MTQDFNLHVEDFRRDYLRRVVVFLAVAMWLIGSPIMLMSLSPTALAMLASFEILCALDLMLIGRGRVQTARFAFIGGLIAWWAWLVWVTREPMLLAVPVLLAPMIVSQFEVRPAIVVAGLLTFVSFVLARAVSVGATPGWQPWLFPLLTVLAVALALLREENFATVLAWTLQSTRSAIERLTEVQEHRARLFMLTRDLDNAYYRLQRVNEMLVAARAEAEEARQARQKFALTVSHELRTPLNFIIGFSELMANSPEIYGDLRAWPSGLYEDAKEIYKSSRHLLSLVNDVLDLGKADAQRLVLIKEWVSPETLAAEAEAIMRAVAVEKGLWLRIETAADLPELFVDRTRIRQVLINLLGNSLRFTEHGGITISVSMTSDDVLFCVRDTGPGIAPEEAGKVFEEFGQANATVWRRRDGAGLGVPISRRLVAMHGGRMWLESTVGAGTAFYFTLPLPTNTARLDLAVDPDLTEYWRVMAEHSRTPKLVLVVSPDPNAGDLIKGLLPEYGVVAADAQTAGQKILGLLPQAIIVDRALASQPGVSALLEGLPYDPPVLTLGLPGSSAHSGERPPGVAAYLMKPVMRADLVATLSGLDLGMPRLLVVDDDPAMARFVKLALAEWRPQERVEVSAALTGGEALQWLAESGDPPGAILLDLSLPDMSGWQLLETLRGHAAWQHIPVVIVTATSLPEELEARERKVLQLSTARPLTAVELEAAITGLLQAVPPRFPATADVPGAPETRAA